MLKKFLIISSIGGIICLSACALPQANSTEQDRLQQELELIRRERELIQQERELIQDELSLIQRERSLIQHQMVNQNPVTTVVSPITTGLISVSPLMNSPRIGPNGEVIITIEPCVTPTVPADYRELLSAGTFIGNNDYYM